MIHKNLRRLKPRTLLLRLTPNGGRTPLVSRFVIGSFCSTVFTCLCVFTVLDVRFPNGEMCVICFFFFLKRVYMYLYILFLQRSKRCDGTRNYTYAAVRGDNYENMTLKSRTTRDGACTYMCVYVAVSLCAFLIFYSLSAVPNHPVVYSPLQSCRLYV